MSNNSIDTTHMLDGMTIMMKGKSGIRVIDRSLVFANIQDNKTSLASQFNYWKVRREATQDMSPFP